MSAVLAQNERLVSSTRSGTATDHCAKRAKYTGRGPPEACGARPVSTTRGRALVHMRLRRHTCPLHIHPGAIGEDSERRMTAGVRRPMASRRQSSGKRRGGGRWPASARARSERAAAMRAAGQASGREDSGRARDGRLAASGVTRKRRAGGNRRVGDGRAAGGRRASRRFGGHQRRPAVGKRDPGGRVTHPPTSQGAATERCGEGCEVYQPRSGPRPARRRAGPASRRRTQGARRNGKSNARAAGKRCLGCPRASRPRRPPAPVRLRVRMHLCRCRLPSAAPC